MVETINLSKSRGANIELWTEILCREVILCWGGSLLFLLPAAGNERMVMTIPVALLLDDRGIKEAAFGSAG